MTDLIRFSVSDLHHSTCSAAGLVHVDGHGSRSIFSGTREQAQAARDALASQLTSAQTGGEKRSIAAAISRIDVHLAPELTRQERKAIAQAAE